MWTSHWSYQGNPHLTSWLNIFTETNNKIPHLPTGKNPHLHHHRADRGIPPSDSGNVCLLWYVWSRLRRRPVQAWWPLSVTVCVCVCSCACDNRQRRQPLREWLRVWERERKRVCEGGRETERESVTEGQKEYDNHLVCMYVSKVNCVYVCTPSHLHFHTLKEQSTLHTWDLIISFWSVFRLSQEIAHFSQSLFVSWSTCASSQR